ncbi:MAG: FAD-dependent monooxygenase [Ardenticatenaceae bacterium]
MERVIIVGGGIGGLCAAIALRQIGCDVMVYERTAQLGRVGAGLTLWANALKALGQLGLAESVISAGAKAQVGQIRHWRGKVLASVNHASLSGAFGASMIAIHRADLHQILLSALPPEVVQLGVACTGFSQDSEDQEGVTVQLADGGAVRADLLIGADGINSVVRQQLFPHVKLRYAGYTAWRGVCDQAEVVQEIMGIMSESWQPGKRFGIMRINERQVYWFATANREPKQTEPANTRKQTLLQGFQGWHDPIQTVLEATPADAILQNDIYDFRPFQPWSKDRVTLLGDAAHATTPNMGQGACMAIESAVILARCMAHSDNLSAALALYERQRAPRTAKITNQSWRIGRLGQMENRLACALRDLVVRLTPAKMTTRQLAMTIEFE